MLKVVFSILTLVFLGFLRESLESSNAIPYNETLKFEAKIVEEPDIREKNQRLIVESEYGKILIFTSRFVQFEYGDKLEIYGKIEDPSTDLEGFNYKNYLKVFGVDSTINNPKIELTAFAKSSFKGTIFDFKKMMELRINSLFFEPEASLAAGLILGSRKGLPAALGEAFKTLGLTHIIAISGYNISLVIACIFYIFSFLPLRPRIILSVFFIFVFTILVGASASVVRAALMGSLSLFGIYSGKKSASIFALLWTAALMISLNPYILLFDMGFQLSFLSTFAIIVVLPLIKEKIKISEGLLIPVAVQIMTFPLMLFSFGKISILSPLVNFIVAPFIPFAMIFSFLALPFGKVLALIASFYLKVMIFLALTFSKIPLLINWKISFLMFGIFYFWIFYWLFKSYKPKLVRAFLRESEAD